MYHWVNVHNICSFQAQGRRAILLWHFKLFGIKIEQYDTSAFFDKIITNNDAFVHKFENGLLKDVTAVLYDQNNISIIVKDGYLIEDIGNQKLFFLIDSETSSHISETKLWSKWLESVGNEI